MFTTIITTLLSLFTLLPSFRLFVFFALQAVLQARYTDVSGEEVGPDHEQKTWESEQMASATSKAGAKDAAQYANVKVCLVVVVVVVVVATIAFVASRNIGPVAKVFGINDHVPYLFFCLYS